MAQTGVRIEGLDDFRRGLRRASGPEFGKKLGQVNKRIAEKVEAEAVARYRRRYRSMSSRTRGAIRSLSQQRAAKVRIGGARAPYLPGQEFGSNRYPQFSPWSGPAPGGRGSRGYFLYPAVRDETEEIGEEYLKELDDLVREAFPRG